MKTLKRIHVKNVSEVLSDPEMRLVVGGYDLPEVTIHGIGKPCNGVGIVFGGCAGTSAQRGDDCDYIKNGYHFKGKCIGNGDPINSVIVADYTILGANGLTCWGGPWGVPCSQSYF